MATFFQAMRIGRVGVMEEICRKQLPLILVPTSDCWICGVQERFRVVFAPLVWEASASLLNVLHAVSSGSKRASFDWSFRKSVKNCEDESTAANHICFLEKPRRMRFKMFMYKNACASDIVDWAMLSVDPRRVCMCDHFQGFARGSCLCSFPRN